MVKFIALYVENNSKKWVYDLFLDLENVNFSINNDVACIKNNLARKKSDKL